LKSYLDHICIFMTSCWYSSSWHLRRSILTILSRDGLNALLAAGIMFAVLVQLKVPLSDYRTLMFESVKSGLATLLWLWLLLDSAFGPWQCRWTRPGDEKSRRIARALASSILLL
jgi:hypothetical protein